MVIDAVAGTSNHARACLASGEREDPEVVGQGFRYRTVQLSQHFETRAEAAAVARVFHQWPP